MSNLFWLSEEQFEKIKPLLPDDVRGVPRVDDRRVLSGIIHVIKRGLPWADCPAEYGPAKTIYNRYARWGEKGVFARIFVGVGRGSWNARQFIHRQYAHKSSQNRRMRT